MPEDVLYISPLVKTLRVVSAVLKEKVQHRPYRVTNSICVVEFERKGAKLGDDDFPVG